MRIKAIARNKVVAHLFSPKRRDAKRLKAERQRIRQNAPHRVDYYHDASDPYSHLMAQVLPEFCRRYEVSLTIHIVAPPSDWAVPDRARLERYSRQDAMLLARKAGLDYSDPGAQPGEDHLQQANIALLQAVEEGAFLDRAADIGHALWSEEASLPEGVPDPKQMANLDKAAQRREADGHYLGATLYYAGEWYWGVDRLHYLETRLRGLVAGQGEASASIFQPPIIPSASGTSRLSDEPVLHWYLSFRSPYTGIVADRVKALADAYGAELKLRFVLPMVMRGMQVPRAKGFYIMSDAVREAERLGVAFGNIMDPVGKPVERGYAILNEAIKAGRGFEFAKSFLSGVWADGLDAGSDQDLKTITERAGLNWGTVKPHLLREDWRAEAERNQAEMLDYGAWGVPSFRVGDTMAWGQDRLWVIEDALTASAEMGRTD